MAEKELKQYFKYKQDSEIALNELNSLKELYRKWKNNDILKCTSLLSEYKINEEIRKINDKLKRLEKESLCEHQDSKKEWEGNDSHKDYYTKKCTSCGCILDSWSI